MGVRSVELAACALMMSVLLTSPAIASDAFESPEAAVDALVAAVKAGDGTRVIEMFGEGSEDLVSTGVEEVDRRNWAEFVEAHSEAASILVDDDSAELFVGGERWPFPVLLVKAESGWIFDIDAARDEILYRRIGRNELSAIDVARTYIRAQYEFFAQDHDGDGVLEFAQHLLSAPGERDGLYFPVDEGEKQSPLGPLIAIASDAGYSYVDKGRDAAPEPYSGYYFRVLTSQSDDAPGGAFDYVINGNMVAGFGMLATPANYGVTGVMSFMVGRNGVIYERNLGTATEEIAAEIESFDPGQGWSVIDD